MAKPILRKDWVPDMTRIHVRYAAREQYFTDLPLGVPRDAEVYPDLRLRAVAQSGEEIGPCGCCKPARTGDDQGDPSAPVKGETKVRLYARQTEPGNDRLGLRREGDNELDHRHGHAGETCPQQSGGRLPPSDKVPFNGALPRPIFIADHL